MNQLTVRLSCVPSVPDCDDTATAFDIGWIPTALVILVIVAVVALAISLRRR
ncbi:hypothetical protein [Lacisediminihabitans sp. H27-G8]|uniref:hypothetical protein n=1 Tax=Lacisediminihabitans sp. H27-G8 TaxID=3111909 RepID=UPI0038FC68D8